MKFAVIVFPGSNCDNDAYYVVEKHLGLSVDFVWHKDNNLDGYDCIIIPGGFSYGDYLRAGAVARFSNIMEEIKKASIKGKLIIGICNGFQILVESGLLPGALITNNSTFVAKKSKTFEEEKKVAEKAPIDGIQIKDLNQNNNQKKKPIKEEFSYSIKIADFYYKDTASMMISRIKDEISLKNTKIQKISKTKFRVLIGPFDDIKSLKESFEKLKSINFENLEIIKNV